MACNQSIELPREMWVYIWERLGPVNRFSVRASGDPRFAFYLKSPEGNEIYFVDKDDAYFKKQLERAEAKAL
jgi:hypothetical protein